MKFDDLVLLVGGLEWFDLATLVQLTDEKRSSITNQLARFGKAGKIEALRRGMYVLAERYRRVLVQPAALANALYRPSYLSGLWALSYHGIIPESVPVFTSVTTRVPRIFTNGFGEFVYRNLKQSMFFGYEALQISGRKALVATPEKAIVDFWYLSPGEWTKARLREMRFTTEDLVDMEKLTRLVEGIGKPRLNRTLLVWRALVSEEAEGVVTL